MTISFESVFTPALETPFSKSFMVSDRLFLFSDDNKPSIGQDSIFSVYDSSGTLLIENQRVTDATEEELAGWTYFGVRLPHSSNVLHVEGEADGGFTIHYILHNPIVQRDTPTANPSTSQQRTFSADGTPGPELPGVVFGNPGDPDNYAALDLPDGGLVQAKAIADPVTNPLIRLEFGSGESATRVSFTPTGEDFFGSPGRAGAIALAQSGGNVHLFYQDLQSGDVRHIVYDSTGNELRAEMLIGGSDNVSYNRPAADTLNATTLNDGRIVLTWTNQRDGIDSDPELFHAIVNADGGIARAPALVNDDVLDGTQYDGRVFALSDGGYVVVYHTIGGAPYRQTALARQFDANGDPVGATRAFPEADEAGQALNAHEAQVFANGNGFMLDGFGTEYTIAIDGQTGSTPPPAAGIRREGTDGPDDLAGGAGNDTLIGLGGDDTLSGGDGSDTLNGGDGDDLIRGGATEADKRDVIYAGAGDDSVDGGYGNDLIYGQGGNDTIAGGFGADELQGQDGDDVITGSAFGDIVFGNAGNDFVNGGFGHDLINGGAGADKFFHAGGTAEQIEGHGSDWVQDYSAAEGDVLVFGGSATAVQFQVNTTHTANKDTGERAGDDDVEEAFVIYKPTGQILWALVDGAGQSEINLQIGAEVFDLLA